MYSAVHAEALRAVEIDVSTVVELGLAGSSDPEVFAAAVAQERALLTDDLGGLPPLIALAEVFGQHAGLGALRAGAAALDASRGAGPVLVHGIARGGCRTAIIMDEVATDLGAEEREGEPPGRAR